MGFFVVVFVFLNLVVFCVCLELIEFESLLICLFFLFGFYFCCDLVILVNYLCLCEFWCFFKVYVMRNVYLIIFLIFNFLV